MTCPKCGGLMTLEALPYLTAPSGALIDSATGGVLGVTDTGLRINVHFCAKCEAAILPPGSRPYRPPVLTS